MSITQLVKKFETPGKYVISKTDDDSKVIHDFLSIVYGAGIRAITTTENELVFIKLPEEIVVYVTPEDDYSENHY